MALPALESRPRRAKSNVKYELEDSWFPESAPRTSIQAHVVELNNESFQFSLFSLADDLLSRAIFGSKHHNKRWNDIIPDSASGEPLLNGGSALRDISAASKLCHSLTNGTSQMSLQDSVSSICTSLLTLATFQRPDPEWASILKHLLFRYGLMYQPTSPVRLCKVRFGQTLAYGLRATRDLEPGLFIMETCSSMSEDLVFTEGPSVIESHHTQRGPQGARAILGPFRYGNHDCKAKCTFKALAGTHAYVYVVERSIKKDEEITVKYEQHGYYRSRCLCFSCTGTPTTDIRMPKRIREPEDDPEAQRPKKKVRRGLKRIVGKLS